jgi:hypothetical protein
VRSSSGLPRRRRLGLAPAVLLLVALSAIALSRVRPSLFDRFVRLRETSDTYALPSAEMTIVASLGYRAALADLLFARVLVAYGLHFEQKRAFEFVASYLDTITALDPKFRAPYYFADTLLTLQAKAPPVENYVRARQILERGMRELPLDSRLWLQAGQFMAYMAPSRFADREVRREWRLEGARRLARACELLSEDQIMPYNCITAAGLLSRQGEIDAMIQFLERVLVVSDNPEIQQMALAMLEKQAGERWRVKVHRLFDELWAQDLAFASKDLLLVLGPPFDPGRCAGTLKKDPECASSWLEWGKRR